MFKTYQVKIVVASFDIKFGRKLTIGVKFEVNARKSGIGSCFWRFLNLKFFMAC